MDHHQEPEDDSAFTRRQLAGLLALMSLAELETTVIPFSGTAVHLRYSGPLDKLQGQAPSRSAESEESTGVAGRSTRIWRFFRSDQILRSSLYLILNYGIQAALGSLFWIIAARAFSTGSVGRASSLYTAATLISFLGLLGLNTTFLRFLPIARYPNKLITVGLALVAVCSGALALVYIVLTPLIARPISFVAHSLPLAVGFVVLTAGAGINGLTDSVFIAVGKAGYNAFVDGVLGGVTKIVLVVALVSGGAYGIFCAATGGLMTAALASLLIMVWVLHWRPQLGKFGELLKPVIRFSGANYAGNALSLLPTLIVPLIVLNRMGASSAAYYYVSFQLATLLYTAVYSVEQAFLVEGANVRTIDRAMLIRSARVLLALCIPAFIAVILFGHQLLMTFGANYGKNAESSLIPLTAAVFPIAANNWFLTILRLSNQLKAIIWSNIVYAIAITGLAWLFAPRGLSGLALAWPIGSSAGALVAGIAAVRVIRRQQPSRHRHGRSVPTQSRPNLPQMDFRTYSSQSNINGKREQELPCRPPLATVGGPVLRSSVWCRALLGHCLPSGKLSAGWPHSSLLERTCMPA